MDFEKQISGKSLTQWQAEFPIMNAIAAMEETAWINPGLLPAETAIAQQNHRFRDAY